VSNIIAMVAESTDLHAYCVHRLFEALTQDIGQQQLCKVAVWTMGEYGDLLLTAGEEGQQEVCVCGCAVKLFILFIYLFIIYFDERSCP